MTRYRIAIMNLKSGREPNSVKAEVAIFMRKHLVDAALISEGNNYEEKLSSLNRFNYVVHDSKSGSGILVESHLTTASPIVKPLGTFWFYKGRRKPRRAISSCLISKNGARRSLRLISYHGPANIWIKWNLASQRLGLRQLARWVNRRKAFPIFLGGDFNTVISSPDITAFANRVNGSLVQGKYFDFGIVRKCKVVSFQDFHESGSDHPWLVLDVEV